MASDSVPCLRRTTHSDPARGSVCRQGYTTSLAVAPRAACMRRALVVGNDRHDEAEGVTGSRGWSPP